MINNHIIESETETETKAKEKEIERSPLQPESEPEPKVKVEVKVKVRCDFPFKESWLLAHEGSTLDDLLILLTKILGPGEWNRYTWINVAYGKSPILLPIKNNHKPSNHLTSSLPSAYLPKHRQITGECEKHEKDPKINYFPESQTSTLKDLNILHHSTLLLFAPRDIRPPLIRSNSAVPAGSSISSIPSTASLLSAASGLNVNKVGTTHIITTDNHNSNVNMNDNLSEDNVNKENFISKIFKVFPDSSNQENHHHLNLNINPNPIPIPNHSSQSQALPLLQFLDSHFHLLIKESLSLNNPACLANPPKVEAKPEAQTEIKENQNFNPLENEVSKGVKSNYSHLDQSFVLLFKQLLIRDSIQNTSEIFIFEVLLKYYQAYQTKIQNNETPSIESTNIYLDLFDLVRFPLMSLEEVVNKVIPSKVLSPDKIFKILQKNFPLRDEPNLGQKQNTETFETFLNSTPRGFNSSINTLHLNFTWTGKLSNNSISNVNGMFGPGVISNGVQISKDGRRVSNFTNNVAVFFSDRDLFNRIIDKNSNNLLDPDQLPTAYDTIKFSLKLHCIGNRIHSLCIGFVPLNVSPPLIGSAFAIGMHGPGLSYSVKHKALYKNIFNNSCPAYGSSVKDGDVVSIIMRSSQSDQKEKGKDGRNNYRVEFYINGLSQGFAFDLLHNIRPAISIADGTDIEIIS